MQEILGAVAILGGFVWAVLYVLSAIGRTGRGDEWYRAVALLLLIGAGSLIPVHTGGDTHNQDADMEP